MFNMLFVYNRYITRIYHILVNIYYLINQNLIVDYQLSWIEM